MSETHAHRLKMKLIQNEKSSFLMIHNFLISSMLQKWINPTLPAGIENANLIHSNKRGPIKAKEYETQKKISNIRKCGCSGRRYSLCSSIADSLFVVRFSLLLLPSKRRCWLWYSRASEKQALLAIATRDFMEAAGSKTRLLRFQMQKCTFFGHIPYRYCAFLTRRNNYRLHHLQLIINDYVDLLNMQYCTFPS